MIAFEICDILAVLRLDAPPVNAISLAMLAELREALRRASAARGVVGIVITGSSSLFSAGADLADFQAIRGADDAVRMSRTFQEAFQEVEDSEKPVLAAMPGHVLGGALELAVSCHFRIAARDSRFSMPEVKLGINPGAGGTQRLPRVIGLQAALRMLLSGDPLDPQQAQDAGLGDSICPPEAWLDNARKILTSTAPRRKTDQRTDRIKDAQANTTAAEASAIDHAMVEFGMAMGPLVLNDMAGMDIFVQTDALLRRAFPYHGEPADIAVRLVQQGHLGQKTGSGVYRYEKGNRAPLPSLTTAQALTEVRQEQGRSPRPISAAEITERLVLRMVNEAFHVLEEGLCQRSSDLDVAMVLGTGLADFRGGVVKYAQDVGPDHVRTQLQKLAAQHGERFAPCQLLFSRKP